MPFSDFNGGKSIERSNVLNNNYVTVNPNEVTNYTYALPTTVQCALAYGLRNISTTQTILGKDRAKLDANNNLVGIIINTIDGGEFTFLNSHRYTVTYNRDNTVTITNPYNTSSQNYRVSVSEFNKFAVLGVPKERYNQILSDMTTTDKVLNIVKENANYAATGFKYLWNQLID